MGVDESRQHGGAACVCDPRACGVAAYEPALDDHSGGPAKFTPIEDAHVGQRDLLAGVRPGTAVRIRHLFSFQLPETVDCTESRPTPNG